MDCSYSQVLLRTQVSSVLDVALGIMVHTGGNFDKYKAPLQSWSLDRWQHMVTNSTRLALLIQPTFWRKTNYHFAHKYIKAKIGSLHWSNSGLTCYNPPTHTFGQWQVDSTFHQQARKWTLWCWCLIRLWQEINHRHVYYPTQREDGSLRWWHHILLNTGLLQILTLDHWQHIVTDSPRTLRRLKIPGAQSVHKWTKEWEWKTLELLKQRVMVLRKWDTSLPFSLLR